MQIRFPLKLEKQCQASCRIDIGIDGFLSRCHRAVTPAIVFGVDTQHVSRVIAGKSGVSGVDWEGNQVYLEWIGTSRFFGMLARPLEFLSTFKLRSPPREVQWEHRDSFPDEAEE